VPPATARPVPSATASVATIEYTVQEGDLLYNLALRYNTTVEEIAALNPRINPDSLVIGDLLRIPAALPPTPQAPTPTFGAAERAYTVLAGDTLYDLAARLGTSVGAIAALNPGIDPQRLPVGQVIRIPAPPPAQEQTP
jgi:LysM repeat protein